MTTRASRYRRRRCSIVAGRISTYPTSAPPRDARDGRPPTGSPRLGRARLLEQAFACCLHLVEHDLKAALAVVVGVGHVQVVLRGAGGIELAQQPHLLACNLIRRQLTQRML